MAVVFGREELRAGVARWGWASQVRFQDVDAAGVVFFARYFDLVHDAYAAFLESRGHPLASMFATPAWILPLRHAEADYLRPLRLGDRRR